MNSGRAPQRLRLNSTSVQRGLKSILSDLSMSGQEGSFPRASLLSASVYTAFDGDDFYFTELMSAHVFSRGLLPINPESCLGYKPAVDILLNKPRVLMADVSLLRKSDELWLYSRQKASAPGWDQLAEGVIIELLSYLTFCESEGSKPRVAFVNLAEVVVGVAATPSYVDIDRAGLVGALRGTRSDLIRFVDEICLPQSKPVAVAVFAIADSKNAPWIRNWMIRKGWAPVVPTLAFGSSVIRGVSDLVDAWARLVLMADLVVVFPSLDGADSDFLRYLDGFRSGDWVSGSWSEVGAPKAVHGRGWPISQYERQVMPQSGHGWSSAIAKESSA